MVLTIFYMEKIDSARKTMVFTMEKPWFPVQCPLASPKILRCCLQSPSPRPFQSHPQASVSVLLTSLTWKQHISTIHISGWWLSHPSEKYESQLGLSYIPNMEKWFQTFKPQTKYRHGTHFMPYCVQQKIY